MKYFIPTDINQWLVTSKHPNELSNEKLQVTIHTILIYQIKFQDLNDEFADISSKVFKQLVGDDYKDYTSYLIESGIIISDNIYVPGSKALGYKIKSTSLNIDTVEIENKTLINRNKQFFKSIQKESGVSYQYLQSNKKYLKSIRISTDAITFIQDHIPQQRTNSKGKLYTQDQCRLAIIKVMSINEGQLIYSRNKTNHRLDTNYTLLDSNLRQFIISDSNLISLDCSNSQPYLLSCLLLLIHRLQNNNYIHPDQSAFLSELEKSISKEHYNIIVNIKINDISELNDFHETCRSGRIYDVMARQLNHVQATECHTRNKVKGAFMLLLFSDKPNNYTSALKDLFPNVAKFIYSIKQTVFPAPTVDRIVKGVRKITKGIQKPGRAIFANYLTIAESKIWITNILNEAVLAGIDCITIHDSVICSEHYGDKMNDIIDSVYSRMLCSNPNIKQELVVDHNHFTIDTCV